MSDEEKESETRLTPDEQAQFGRLLEFLHRSRGFDFTGYKAGSLARRVRRRMAMVGIDSFEGYLDHLEVHPEEFPQLFNVLLINVTSFLRDPLAWQALTDRLPEVIDLHGDRPIRVWSAGCSSGEEAYTLTMVLAETLGTAAFAQRVKVYATDIDEDALATARAAVYPRKALETVPSVLVEKYFSASGSQLVFNKELRRAVVFGRHDLVQDAPIPRVDVLACRNALMYFNGETQKRVLERLRFALAPRGILFLGKAEMLLTQSDLFTPVDLKRRLFVRSSKTRGRDRAPMDAFTAPRHEPVDDTRARLQQAAFDCGRSAQIIVDTAGNVALVNARATQLFGLSPVAVVGHPFSDLDVSYRPVELRSCIERVRADRRPIELKGVERIGSGGEKTYLDVEVVALVSPAGIVGGTLIAFTDATHTHQLQSDLRRTNDELEAAHQEVQATSEELETTNEELQSTVEELETTNEELQSTNEELETMNEELQTINEELRQRGKDLNEANSFHHTVLASLRAGIAVLDEDLAVRTWNEKMEDLWGAREDEVVNRRFTELDIGLPVDDLRPSIRSCLAGGEDVETVAECTNRRGRSTTCRIVVVPLRRFERRGVVIVVEELRGNS